MAGILCTSILKFSIQKTLPPEVRNFNTQQRQVMKILSERMPGYEDGQAIHDGISSNVAV